MKIIDNTNTQIHEFKNMYYGEIFEYGCKYYICTEIYDTKTDTSHAVGVNLYTGTITTFKDEDFVHPCPNSYVTIKR